VSRAPFAEWQVLLAAGGAPAASHAALERMPIHTRLLAPLANSLLVREGSFDTLVRPVELAAVLGRLVAGQRAAPDSATDATEDIEAAGRRVRTRGVERRMSSRSALATVEGAPRSGARDADVRRHPLPPREPQRPRMGATPSAARQPGAVEPAEAHVVSSGARRRVAGASGATGASRPRGDVAYAMTRKSEATRNAAICSIAVDAASPSVRRLLDAVAASNGASSGARARDEANGAHPALAQERFASAMERILEKLATRKVSRASADGTERPSESRRLEPARETGTTERAARSGAPLDRTVSASAPQHAPLTTTTAATAGGFRGLAERAMRQSDGATPAVSVVAPRLSHEVRTISDLPLDALDASVAESVTRILQREARRHGIDLAGTGA
jgi:hypothetical protein